MTNCTNNFKTLTAKTMLNCIKNSKILRESLELLSDDDDYDINNEFEMMCSRFGLNETQMISLVTTVDLSLLNNNYETIWDSLNYYSMACMNDYITAYIESLYKTDLMDPRMELLCDDLKEYIKCNLCINNSGILRLSLELLSNDDYDINNEFKTMCTRFGLNETQMISLITTLDISLLNDYYTTIWDGLNYYSMACMDDYKKVYIESLYKTDLMDERIELLCDDLKEYIKCNSCVNVENNKCSTFKDACERHHDTCVKYLLNNPQKT